MNAKYQRVLEYNKILEKLKEYAVSEIGRELAGALEPANELEAVKRLQAETDEALSVIAYTGGNPLSGFKDVREYLRLSRMGSVLTMKALLEISGVLNAMRQARRALVTEREDTPILSEMASRIYTNVGPLLFVH